MPTFDEALAAFQVQLQADGRSHHTRAQYARHLQLLATWCVSEGRSPRIEDLGHEDIARFLASPSARTRADGMPKRATSLNALRSSLRAFFGFAHAAGWTSANPARLIKRAITSPPPPRALTTKEEERFLAALAKAHGAEEERDAVLFRLLLRTGLRLSSAVGLDIEDIDLDDGVLAVHTKRDRRERVFIAKAVQKELRRFIGHRESGPLFTNQAGRGITTRHAQRRFGLWRERAGLPDAVSPHALRHTFATRLLARTGDLALVQRALTHSSITSTTNYLRCDDARLREAIGA